MNRLLNPTRSAAIRSLAISTLALGGIFATSTYAGDTEPYARVAETDAHLQAHLGDGPQDSPDRRDPYRRQAVL